MSTQNRREFLTTAFALAGAGSTIPNLKAGVPPDSADRRPNILLFFPDQHRFDWLGTNPHLPVRTPNLDKLAQRGVRFTHAFTPDIVRNGFVNTV